MKDVCFILCVELPYKNMATRNKLRNLAINYRLTVCKPKGISIPEEIIDKITSIEEPIWQLKWKKLNLFFFMPWLFYRFLIFKIKNKRFDFVYSLQTIELIAAYWAVVLGICKKFVCDIMDDPELELDNWKIRLLSYKDKLNILKINLMIYVLSILEWIKRYIIFKKADLVFVLGENEKSPLINKMIYKYNIPAKKIIPQPNGIWLEEILKYKLDNKISLKNIKNKNFKIFYVGYVSKLRGMQLLLESISLLQEKIPNLYVVLAGPSKIEDRIEIENLITELKLKEKVEYIGETHTSEITWKLIQEADVCVYPFQDTRLSYVYPVKVLEYLAFGKAVVATKLEGVSAIIKDGYNGLLASPNSAREFAMKIFEIYKDPVLRKTIEENAKKSIKAFDYDYIFELINVNIERIFDKEN